MFVFAPHRVVGLCLKHKGYKMKKTLLFCLGESGSGKSYFIKNTLPDGLFYNLRSATTRPMRNGESEGDPYFFRNEEYFDTTPLVTRLWVNKDFWCAGKPKWLYGVPETEVLNHLGQNLIYDVIEPKYARQMIDWFVQNDLACAYNFHTAYFLSPENNLKIAANRANMPNDIDVRKNNTCTPDDFLDAGLQIDFILKPINNVYDSRLIEHIAFLQKHK